MTKKLLGLSFIVSIFFISCESDDIQNSSTDESNDIFQKESDSEVLRSAVTTEGAGVLGITTISGARNSKKKDVSEIGQIALEQIATIDPPVLDGQAMRANHVEIDGDYAYVAYTKEGATYLGGIDIIDISNKFEPKVISRVTTNSADVNALFYKENKIYFTGAYNDQTADPVRAFYGTVETAGGQFTSDFTAQKFSLGQAGVDILPFDSSFIAVSGSDGVIASYDSPDSNLKAEASYSDLRSAAYANGNLVALSGDNGLLVLDNQNLTIKKEIALSGLVAESKRTMEFIGNLLMISEGAAGIGIYNTETWDLVTRLPINTIPDAEIAEGEKVTNAVSSLDQFILMANGGAGFGIARLDATKALAEEGIIEIDGSANYVKAKGDYIFVASGTGGLRILKMSRPNVDNGAGEETAPEFAECSSYEIYNEGPYFNVNSNEEKAYSGSATVLYLNVSDKLTYCGSLNVQNTANINSNGEFNMNGSFAVGAVGKNLDLNINANSVLRIQGSVTVYGNLNLNSRSTLEFVGNNSSIHIYGEVRKGQNVTITGNYTDTSDKL
ncbi:hypothetical protein RM549_18940 [Salegentibacter sp. F188]|uniref:LVIVD repeat-containing protein n=1 Tax=Autumnicola patrickiae TaxID=3075591 RepID=A0ABU3E7B0_9FLAO|nr:hypothetical protein [Salegentibacter sp. F188]MDT0691876.1 hypothetical protein [Salegentibacter sp. F188]